MIQNVFDQRWECISLDEGFQQTVVVAHMGKFHFQKLAAVHGVIECRQILVVILDAKALQLERSSQFLSLHISRSWQLSSGHGEWMKLREGDTEKGREHSHSSQKKLFLPEK